MGYIHVQYIQNHIFCAVEVKILESRKFSILMLKNYWQHFNNYIKAAD